MPGDAGETLVLLQLARCCQLWFKHCQNQPSRPRQRMFLFSSPPVWFTTDCRRVGNRATSSSFRDETGRFEGDCSRCVLCRAPPIQITAWQSARIFCRTRQTRHLIKVKFLSATLLICGCGAAAFVIWLAFRINSRAALSVGKSRSE